MSKRKLYETIESRISSCNGRYLSGDWNVLMNSFRDKSTNQHLCPKCKRNDNTTFALSSYQAAKRHIAIFHQEDLCHRP